MPFLVSMPDAAAEFPEYQFVSALTPSEQKAAFHVRDASGRDLCLKIISPNYSVDRLNREIQALQRVTHPNVVRLEEYTYSSRATGLRHYMVEEFIPGTDLSDQLTPGTPWPVRQVVNLFEPLCHGLNALRVVDLVHRDLKPHNIRVRPDGNPVIIDFGVVRHLTLPDLTGTAFGAALGTPAYFAPEQFEGTKRDIDHRTDLFALGVMMYEAAVGKHPFLTPGITIGDLAEIVCRGNDHLMDPVFSRLSPPLQLLLARLLEKDRLRRPGSAEIVIRILRKVTAAA